MELPDVFPVLAPEFLELLDGAIDEAVDSLLDASQMLREFLR